MIAPRLRIALYALLLALCCGTAVAQKATDPTPLRFRDVAEEQRFHDLVAELRCVMCQNQSLADSNAQIAVDLRREVLALMREGRSDQEVRDFLVARYGEFVLLKPRLEGHTLILWAAAPAVFLLGALALWMNARRRRTAPAAAAALNVEEQAALRRLMEKGDSDGAARRPRA